MTELVVCLSGEHGRQHALRLINDGSWENVFIITDKESSASFKPEMHVNLVVVDFKKQVFELIEDIKGSLKGKLLGIEVALNMVSGSGKEHMAILSALLQLGFGIRLVAVTNKGIQEI